LTGLHGRPDDAAGAVFCVAAGARLAVLRARRAGRADGVEPARRSDLGASTVTGGSVLPDAAGLASAPDAPRAKAALSAKVRAANPHIAAAASLCPLLIVLKVITHSPSAERSQIRED
jgi:hypothetical protein